MNAELLTLGGSVMISGRRTESPSPTAFLLSAQTVDDAGDHTQEAGDAAPAARSKGEIEPGLAAKIERGRELLFAARIDEAIEVAAELIDAAPEDSIGYRIRVDAAFCDLVWGDFDRAAADCTAVLRIDGPDAAVLCSRGHAYWLVGDNESARRDFEEALLVKPGYAKALNNLGFLAKENGDFREAMDYFSRAIESNSEYSFAYANRGHLHYLEGRLEAALADQNEALRLAPRRLFQTYVDRGDTHAALEEWQAAIFDYGNAIQLDYYSSAYGGVFEKRGKAYEMTGALERAAVDFARAKEFE